jgi:hypothetical protein
MSQYFVGIAWPYCPQSIERGVISMAKPITVLLTLFALGAAVNLPASAADAVDVYKSPYCGCCEKWVEHLQQAGFAVRTHDVNDVPAAC